MTLRNKLAGRLSQEDIHELVRLAKGKEGNSIKEELYELSTVSDKRISANALWVFTHFDQKENKWLFAKHDDLINKALAAKDQTRLRLLLTILLRQPFAEDSLRTEFIDFCFDKITSRTASGGIRALSIKLAYEQCRFYPELLAELQTILDALTSGPIAPSIASARRLVMNKLTKKTN